MRTGIPVAFVPCPDYGNTVVPGRTDPRALSLPEAVDAAFALAGYAPARGERVLVGDREEERFFEQELGMQRVLVHR